MTPEQNDYLKQQSYLRQTQERRDARANMPGPSGNQGMSQARFQEHQARMQSDAIHGQMSNIAAQAASDRYKGGRPMNNESAGPAPTPGHMMTQAIPENGGGSIRDGLGSNQQRRFDKRVDRHQRRQERAGRRASRDMRQAEANGANDFEMKGRAMHHNVQTMHRDLAFDQKMQGLYGQNSRGGGGARPNPTLGRPRPGANGDRFPGMGGVGTATTMAVPEGGGGRPTPTQGSGGSGGSRPNFPGMPGFAPPKAGDGNGPTPRPTPNRGNNPTPAPEPRPTPNPTKEKRREARTQRRADRQERRQNRADKRFNRAKAQKFKNDRQKRITGKDEMPYS